MNEHAAFVIDIVDLALFHAKRDANKTILLSTGDVGGGMCWAEYISNLEAALAWLRSLPDQQVVRVPKIRKVNSAVAALAPDCASAFDAGVEAMLCELRELNPGAKIVEV